MSYQYQKRKCEKCEKKAITATVKLSVQIPHNLKLNQEIQFVLCLTCLKEANIEDDFMTAIQNFILYAESEGEAG